MDIRIDTKFLSHPKTKKLLRRLGPEGVLSLIRLWLWAAENRPTGELHGLDSEDIDLISEWSDRPGADQIDHRSFCQEAMELHWIDTSADGIMFLHEWALYNPWAADAPKRSDKARLSRLANVAPEAYLKLVKEGRVSITKEEYREIVEGSTPRRRPADAASTPAPAPAPAPSPAIKKGSDPEELNDRRRVLEAYHDFPGYKADLLYKENIWADSLIARFAGLDICEELEKARRWIECREGFEVKNSRAYITKWLERVQKERS